MSPVTQTAIGAVNFTCAAALLCAVGWGAAVPGGIAIAAVLVLVSRLLQGSCSPSEVGSPTAARVVALRLPSAPGLSG